MEMALKVMQWVAFVAGLSAVALYLWCFQLKEAKKIVACKILSNLFYFIQYILLFAWVGAAMDVAALITSFFAYKKDNPFVKKHKIPILIITNLSIVTVGLLLFENFFSLFCIAGVLVESLSTWMKNEKMIRVISLFAVPCWLVYNVAAGAYGSLIGNVLAMISIVASLIRYSSKIEKIEKAG